MNYGTDNSHANQVKTRIATTNFLFLLVMELIKFFQTARNARTRTTDVLFFKLHHKCVYDAIGDQFHQSFFFDRLRVEACPSLWIK